MAGRAYGYEGKEIAEFSGKDPAAVRATLEGTLSKTFKIILCGHGSGGILSGLAIRLWRENESPAFDYDLHRPRSISGDLGMFIKA